LFDCFGFEWTLLCLGDNERQAGAFLAAAAEARMDLKVFTVDDEEARDLYESDLVLIRPDQIVAWRYIADSVVDPAEVLGCAIGDTLDGKAMNDNAAAKKAASLSTAPVCDASETVRLRI